MTSVAKEISRELVMYELGANTQIGVVGAGTMGTGIAQIAAQKGHFVFLCDVNAEQLERSKASLTKILNRLEEKGRLGNESAADVLARVTFSPHLDAAAEAGLVVEAIVEKLDIKQDIFKALEGLCAADTILATNTSSLSVASIGAACEKNERVVGLHFFNPAPLMALVEIVPGIFTHPEVVSSCTALMREWGKVPVTAKDTPGFIVNRVARPFYGESIRILEEGIADVPTIDWALKELGGFRMGPFELMDLIGNDVNLAVTETVFREFFYDPRFKPSFTQKRLVEAGYLGRKAGRGYYMHGENASNPEPSSDQDLGNKILWRVRSMLINEACDAVLMNVASAEDVDLAMTKGVNYPKGLLAWCDELGAENVLREMEMLFEEYGEDRYRPNPLLRRKAKNGELFFS